MKKKRLIIISIIILIFVIAGGIYANNYRIENGAARYLAKKYNWEISDIKEIEHQKGYIDYSLFPLDFYFNKYNPKWVYEYNGRKFNVEYTNFHFADDYQLEDIFTWCTEYLQENIDKDIVGVEMNSNIIFRSSDNENRYILPWSYKKVFSKSDAKDLLMIQDKINEFTVFYQTDNLSFYADFNSKGQNYIPNKNYSDFKTNKKQLLQEYGKSNIVITSKTSFKRNSFGIILSSRSQTSYTLANVSYVYKQ